QDAPDVSLVIAHPAPVLDQLAHPVCGPQPGSVSERLGSALERVFELLELGATQSGLAPSPSGLLQTRFTGLRKLPRPANHRLPMHPQAPPIKINLSTNLSLSSTLRFRFLMNGG